MLKIFANLFRKKDSSLDSVLVYPEGKRYYRESHTIRKTQIDPDALKIIHRLNKFGYKAFVVGGGVRDLIIGRKPKDFDVATNATPNQIKKMFNNCRIIGRRFKIVHVLFKGKVIEVSTFRSLPDHRNESHDKDKDYLIKKDNVFGTAKEDAARRDFTINSLYFDTRNESIIDYVGGFDDINNRILRVIGDADMSFKEDPVRMLRAVKFSVLLGLEIDKKTKAAIKKNRLEILKASSARLIEEYNKIFRTWKTSLIFKGLAENHLLDVMIPEPFAHIKKDDKWGDHFLESGVGKRLAIVDKLLSEREEMTPCIFYALIAYDLVNQALDKSDSSIAHHIKTALDPFCDSMGVSKRDKDKLIKIFTSQPRFLSIEDEKADQNAFFKKKDYFYDAFMTFKIIAISKQDDQALQSAFFWEISLRQRPVRDYHNRRNHGSNSGSSSNTNFNTNSEYRNSSEARTDGNSRNNNNRSNREDRYKSDADHNSSSSERDNSSDRNQPDGNKQRQERHQPDGNRHKPRNDRNQPDGNKNFPPRQDKNFPDGNRIDSSDNANGIDGNRLDQNTNDKSQSQQPKSEGSRSGGKRNYRSGRKRGRSQNPKPGNNGNSSDSKEPGETKD